MKSAIYAPFFFVAVHFVKLQPIVPTPQLCNKTYFTEHVVKPGSRLNDTMLAYLASTCADNNCSALASSKLDSYIRFLPNEDSMSYAEAGAIEMFESTDCWGYYFEISGEEKNSIYHDYLFSKMTFQKKFNFSNGEVYTVAVCALPRCSILRVNNLKMPNDGCEALVWEAASKAYDLSIGQCGLPAENSLQRISEKYCYANKNLFLKETFRKQVAVIACDFQFKLHGKEENKSMLLGILLASVAFMVLAFIMVVFVVCRRMKSSFKRSAFSNSMEILPAGMPRSVMILHCPGCDILDVFIRDLAYVLKSYKLNVKSALLEQTIVDEEGGISSFIQRNIGECNFILIVFTERTKALNFVKHKPFQFALRILGGLAFSGYNKATFVPVYLTDYKKAIKLLPPFLYPSMDNGFRLPEDLKMLITMLLNKKDVDITKEQIDKMKFFQRKMKTQAQKILAETHPDCTCDSCIKGEVDYAESELWAAESLSNPSTYLPDTFSRFDIANGCPSPFQSISNVFGANISIMQIINDKTMIQRWQRDNCDLYNNVSTEKCRYETKL